MSHIQFDYSKALKFFAQHELDYIQYQVTAADKALREGTGPGNDLLDGLICQKIMTKKNSRASKRQRKKSNPIQKFWLLSVSVVLI